MHVVERSLFLGISRMLWGLKITPKIRVGKLVPINPDKLTGICVHAGYVECEITSRDEKRARLIREDREGAKEEYIDIFTGQL